MLKPSNYKARALASACPDSWVDDGAWRRRWRHTCRQRQNLWRARATHFYLLYNKLCPKTEHFTQNTTLRWLSFLSSHWDTLTPPRNYSCFRWFFSASQNEVELQKGFYHISFIIFNEHLLYLMKLETAQCLLWLICRHAVVSQVNVCVMCTWCLLLSFDCTWMIEQEPFVSGLLIWRC